MVRLNEDWEIFSPVAVFPGVFSCMSYHFMFSGLRPLCSWLAGHPWSLIFSSSEHGFSLKSLYRKTSAHECPMLLFVQDTADQVRPSPGWDDRMFPPPNNIFPCACPSMNMAFSSSPITSIPNFIAILCIPQASESWWPPSGVWPKNQILTTGLR